MGMCAVDRESIVGVTTVSQTLDDVLLVLRDTRLCAERLV